MDKINTMNDPTYLGLKINRPILTQSLDPHHFQIISNPTIASPEPVYHVENKLVTLNLFSKLAHHNEFILHTLDNQVEYLVDTLDAVSAAARVAKKMDEMQLKHGADYTPLLDIPGNLGDMFGHLFKMTLVPLIVILGVFCTLWFGCGVLANRLKKPVALIPPMSYANTNLTLAIFGQ